MTILDLPVVRRVLTSSLVDTLTAPHGIDRYLELVDPVLAVHEVRGRVLAVDHTTPDTVTVTVAVNAAWRGHVAGQFVRVGAAVDGAVHTRCYSVESPSTPPGPATVSFSVGEVPGGTLSPHLVRNLRAGDVLRLSPAEGDFTLPADPPTRILLVGAGTGITPLAGMLRELCATGAVDGRDVTVLAYASTADHQLHRAEFLRLAAHHPGVRVVFGCTEAPGTGDVDGLFTADHLDVADPQWRAAELYVCGATPFMAAVTGAAEAAGRGDAVHTEAFAPTFVEPPADGTGVGTVSFTTSGRRAEQVTTSILEAAEAEGLRPAHGCRMGICHTCTRPKQAGCVRNLVTGEVSGPEPADIQICVNAPVGDVVVDL